MHGEVEPVGEEDLWPEPGTPVEPWAVLLAIVGGVVMVAAMAWHAIG